MRIAYIVPWFWRKPRSTASEYHLELVSELGRNGNKIQVFCFSDDSQESLVNVSDNVIIKSLPPNRLNWPTLLNIWKSLKRRLPYAILKYDVGALYKVINQAYSDPSEKPNIALLAHIESSSYASLFQTVNVPVLLHLHDIEAMRYRLAGQENRSELMRLLFRFEARRMLAYELATVQKIITACLSEEERNFIQKLLPERKIGIVPLGLNLSRYPFEPANTHNNKILFVGPADYYKNEVSISWFVKNVYPLILKLWPEGILRVVNVKYGSPVDQLIRSYPRTETTQFVSNVQSEMLSAAVTIAPMRIASGVSGRVLSSLAIGAPMVATSLACQGLNVKNGQHLLIADEPKEFANAVVSYAIAMKNNKRERMLMRGRAYIEEHHDIRKVASLLEDTLVRIIEDFCH